jgi:hypothetical protein
MQEQGIVLLNNISEFNKQDILINQHDKYKISKYILYNIAHSRRKKTDGWSATFIDEAKMCEAEKDAGYGSGLPMIERNKDE